eukprot:TRINITY_DN2787_c0_g1_i1.p5 TRINITY_DN2787_c0_g1~~TRINITY_DN2787_c0_g1_i1.p5  ORF type:complete len:100 (-),score=4.02 TRINITY_DN2787_c0_g1_i1:1494-1793(-)
MTTGGIVFIMTISLMCTVLEYGVSLDSCRAVISCIFVVVLPMLLMSVWIFVYMALLWKKSELYLLKGDVLWVVWCLSCATGLLALVISWKPRIALDHLE